jgi:hypothetical protein
MNERIKELAEQAEKYADDNFRGEPTWSEAFESKFAELIVKECVEQSMSIGRYNTPSGITPDLSIAIAVGLKKHFGVEE